MGETPDDLALGNARLAAAGQHAPERMGGVFDAGKRLDGKWRAFKTLVILNGPEATLRVPPRDRSSFLLAYDHEHFRGTGPGQIAFFRSDGQAAVRFVNCSRPRRDLEFPGGLLARRPGCYRVQAISRDGSLITSGVVNIAMGRHACASDDLANGTVEAAGQHAPRPHF